jgi:hypothetical protein
VSLQIKAVAIVPGLVKCVHYSHVVEGIYGFKNFVMVLLTPRNVGKSYEFQNPVATIDCNVYLNSFRPQKYVAEDTHSLKLECKIDSVHSDSL